MGKNMGHPGMTSHDIEARQTITDHKGICNDLEIQMAYKYT